MSYYVSVAKRIIASHHLAHCSFSLTLSLHLPLSFRLTIYDFISSLPPKHVVVDYLNTTPPCFPLLSLQASLCQPQAWLSRNICFLCSYACIVEPF